MFSWLNGPGAVFRQPRPGSTNYLGSYDREGRLKTVAKRSGQSSEDDLDESSDRESTVGRLEMHRRPFPTNPGFISLPVLADDFREEIYQRVMMQRKTIRDVSADLNVDMNRVAAVVRLKEVEKRWVEEVGALSR